MSGPSLAQSLLRTILLGLAGILLSMLAIGQEQPPIVTGVDLYKNPYQYQNQVLWLNPIPVPLVYNGRIVQYAQPSPDAMHNVLALGYTGLAFNRALDAKRLLFNLREQNYATSSSDLETYGQLVVVVRDHQQLPLQLDRIWVLKGLGSLKGTNGFGAPITVPLVEFLYYPGDEPSPPRRMESPKQTGPQQQKPRSAPAVANILPGCMPLDTNSDFQGLVIIHEGFGTWTALKLERPLCIADSGSRLEEIQLLDESYGALFQSLNNTRVRIAGKLVSGEGSPYYRTFFAIAVKSVHTPGGNTLVPTSSKQVAIPREITTYHARVNTTLNPNHIVKTAWAESGRQLEPVNSYVNVYLNGTGEMAHLSCAEGFVMSEFNSSSLSAEERNKALITDNDLLISIATSEELPSLESKCRASSADACTHAFRLVPQQVSVAFSCHRKR